MNISDLVKQAHETAKEKSWHCEQSHNKAINVIANYFESADKFKYPTRIVCGMADGESISYYRHERRCLGEGGNSGVLEHLFTFWKEYLGSLQNNAKECQTWITKKRQSKKR